ncbi:putative nuclease HARBI1 [Genypterus blacodes]|uniref:putative nuclease HARBI1 n=1 Tax=Genypterus blacodes TaxID=154954 RepID=UPI003F776379
MAFALPVWIAVQDELLGHGADGESPNCFDSFDDETLFEMFHLTRTCVAFVADTVRLHMRKRRTNLSVEDMVMVTLDYYAQGLSSAAVQNRVSLSLAESFGAICAVTEVIADMADRFISFPETLDARASVATDVEKFCGIPKVLGVLAPGHFRVRTSTSEKGSYKNFLNSLGYTSVQTQIICDCEGNILSAAGCWAGSTSEMKIWESSAKGKEMEEGVNGSYWLIGGEGYCLSKAVLSPVVHPTSVKEIRFNQAHEKILDIMRTTLASMMSRFRCLMQLGFAEESSLDKKGNIIKACCVLHNIAKKFSVPLPPESGEVEPLHLVMQYQGEAGESNLEALKARHELIDSSFSEERK